MTTTLPEYVLTRGVTMGGAAAITASLRIRLEVRASRSLIWDATGYRFEAAPVGVVTGAPGLAATLTLPRTDVAGWRDAATGSLIDVSADGSFTHTYEATATFLSADGRALGVQSVTIGPFVLPAGDGSPVDLDSVIPAPGVAGGVVAVPDSWSVLVAAAQAAALAATDAGNVTSGVFDLARIPALPYDADGAAAAAQVAAQAAAAADATAKVAAEASLARNADNLDSGTVADARLPVTARAATLAAKYVSRVAGLIANDATAPVKTANAAILAAAMVPNASVLIPAGTYYTNEVSVTGPLNLEGADVTTTLRNDSGTVLVLAGNQINVAKLTLRSDGGNHTIRQSAAVDQGTWDRFRVYQMGAGYSIWDNAGFGVIDMRFTNFLSWHIQTATVPAWKMTAAGGTIGANTWEKFRAQYSGNYHFWVESTDVNSQHGNAWRDATWETTTGGMLKLIGCRDYIVENSAVWDLGAGVGGVVTLTKHGIHADTNASNASCVGTIRNHRRLDSTCAAGIQDIKLPSSFRGDGTVLENCRNTTPANPLLIDIQSNVTRVLVDGPTASSLATIINATTTHLVDRTGITLPSTQSFKIGSSTLVGFGLAQLNVVADPASIPAGAELDVVLAVPGALSSDACSVSPGFYLDVGLGVVGCWAGANTVTFRLRNFTAAAIDSASHTWRVRVWR